MGIKDYNCGCTIFGPLWIKGCKYHLNWQRTIPLKTIMACIILDKVPEQLDAYEDQIVITTSYARSPEIIKHTLRLEGQHPVDKISNKVRKRD